MSKHIIFSDIKVVKTIETWTDVEVELLRRNYLLYPVKELREKFFPNRSAGSIAAKAEKCGLIRRSYWRPEENDILTKLYSNTRVEDIIPHLQGRSANAIKIQARKLGLFNQYNRQYSRDENEFIENVYCELSDSDIGDLLGRSAQCIKEQRRQLGLKRPKKIAKYGYEDVNSFLRRKNLKWKTDSMIQCGYCCIVTGRRFNAIHHLYSMDQIVKQAIDSIWPDDFVLDINKISQSDRRKLFDVFIEEQAKYPLGICLCNEVHKDFHNKYGYGNNTPEQFREFLLLGESELNSNNICLG